MSALCSQAYLSAQVNTADPLELIISLYETAILNVRKAMTAIAEEDPETRRDAISKTAEILMTLTESLDYTVGDSLAGHLFGLYNFQLEKLLEANRNEDIEALQSVKSTLSILLNGWQEVATNPEAQQILAERESRGESAISPHRAALSMTV